MALAAAVSLALPTLASATPPARAPVQPPASAPVTSTPAPAAAATTPDVIIDRYEKAIGGRERWLRERSRTLVYAIELRNHHSDGRVTKTTGTKTVLQKAPDRMVARTVVPGQGREDQGFDGTRGWRKLGRAAPKIFDGRALADRRREAIIDREVRLRELYPTMEVLGERDLEGRPTWMLRFVSKDGAEAHAWFDRENGRMLGFTRLLELKGTKFEVAERYSDWRESDGQWFPWRIEHSVGSMMEVTTLQSISHEPIEDSEFEIPGATATPPTPPAGDAPKDAPSPPAAAPPAGAPSG